MNIITGYRGEPHITSDQDRAANQGSYGTGMYILDVGDKLASEIISANEVRIRDGVLCMQGCVANITEGAYDSCTISNGTQGMKRSDLIVARYTKDSETNVEDISLVVIEGTPAASSPSDPSYNNGDIQQGDSPVDFPLYRVNINGITISSLTRLAGFVRTQKEMDTLLGSTSISGIGGGTVTGAISALNTGKVSGTKGQIQSITNTSTYDMIANGFFSGGHAYFVVLMQTSYVTIDAVSIYGVRLSGTLNAAISEVVLGSSARAPRLVLDGTKIYLRTNGDTNNINMGYIIYEMA